MFLKLAVPLAVAAIFLPQPARGQSASATGVLSGCVIDTSGQRLPGATITVAGPALDSERLVVGGSDGCYHLDLPPGVYDATTSLTGFAKITRHETPISVGRPERIDFVLGGGALYEPVFVPLADYWRQTDAVVQVRIERVEQDTTFLFSAPATRYTARVVTVWKPSPQAPLQDTVQFLQFQRRPHPDPVGAEFVVFLRWNTSHAVYIADSEFSGDHTTSLLLLDNGRTRDRASGEYEGKPWFDLISALQRLQRN